ncbi:MAG: ABC transporter ATP-binding protein [Carbonactinosporaceae bacterium]
MLGRAERSARQPSSRAARGVSTLARIRIQGLDIDYRRPDGSTVAAVAGFSLDVPAGEFLTLIGPSGCGKTSILRATGGLIRPARGSVQVRETVVSGPLPDHVAYVFQDFALFPWRTAAANVEVALELKGVGRAERRDRVRRELARVGLEDAAERYPHELSGGMQQRVALARALVSDCDVLLLDEPFGALDEQTRLVLGTELLRILEASGKTIVFVTHSLQEAVYLSDRVVAVTARPGRIKEILEIPLARPRTPEVMVSDEFTALQSRLLTLLYEESSLALEAGR